MKKMLLSLFGLISFSTIIFAQCDELFISEYVNGFGNNRALELYNPTPDAIDLAEYSVGRFRNGQVTWFGYDIPAGEIIQPYSTYVIVSDKRTPNTTYNNFEHPVWNGYLVLGPVIDELTNEPLLDNDGNEIIAVQYETVGSDVFPLYGDVYNEDYDLDGKADLFICPVYEENKAFYFNGNDATVLAKGENPPVTYGANDEIGMLMDDCDNLIDVVGVVGEDPEEAFGAEGWPDPEGTWYTVNKTIVRTPSFKSGVVNAIELVDLSAEDPSPPDSDTFDYQNWEVYPKHTFSNLGWHSCECDPNYVAGIEDNLGTTDLYPNPVSDGNVIVESEGFVSEILVFNIAGKKVRTILVSEFSNRLQINLGNLDTGMYIMQLKFADGTNGVQKISIK